MPIQINLPSGLTFDSLMLDLEALTASQLQGLMPDDVQRLLLLAEQLVKAAGDAIISPSPAATLTAEIAAEQAAGTAAEDAKFPPGTK